MRQNENQKICQYRNQESLTGEHIKPNKPTCLYFKILAIT